jgi:surfeit locus 1 family protein
MPIALPNAISFFARRRFRPRWLPTLAMVVFVAVTVALGNWQRHRAAEKNALAARFAAVAQEPPVELPARDDDALGLRFHAVRVHGRYDASHQIFIDNKVHAGRAGFHVVAPLKIGESGRYVLIDRGWIAQGATRAALPVAPPPSDVVTVQGRVNLPPQHYLELGTAHPAGALWENLDVQRIVSATGLDLLPVVVEQTDPVEPPDALVRDWPLPDVGSAQNVSYMLQWYSLGGLAVALWLALNWRPRVGQHGG